MRKLSILAVAGGLLALASAAGTLADDWAAYETATRKGKVRTATNVLVRIEGQAAGEKAWPDLAAAMMMRTRLEYGFTEESALDAERQTGFVAKYAARVEASPAEVRPMLRLALAHDYLSMRDSMRWWKDDRTQLANATNQPPWSAERIVPTLSALFDAIAADRDALLAQKLDDWSRLLYTGDAFARACRPTLWDFAVNDAVDFSGRVRDDDQVLRRKVLGWLDGLAAAHPVDREPDAHVYSLYRKLLLDGGDKLAFAERWFDVSAVSADAASAAVAALAASETGADRVRAHEIAARFFARWPKSPGGRDCLQRMRSLEQPFFSLSVENQLLARGEKISVSSRNLTNLCFRLVPVTFTQLVEGELSHALRSGGAEPVFRKLLLEQPAAEWSFPLVDEHDYVNHTADCAIPADLPLGYYVLFAAANDKFGADKLPSVCTVVSRTDLYLVHRTDANGWTGFVVDAETGAPRADVAVEFWQSVGRGHKLYGSTRSAADGSWSLKAPEENDSGFVRARLATAPTTESSSWNPLKGLKRARCGDQGTMQDDIYWQEPYRESEPDPTQIFLVTDRALYRPGQTIRFKGYAYHASARARDFHVLPNRRVFVDLKDVNRKQVAQLALISNDFGTFTGEFTAPRDRLTGCYTIAVRLRADGAGKGAWCDFPVSVEEYKRPKFTASFGRREGLKLGEETKLHGVATAYTGVPVQGAKVKWEIRRETIRPYWWSWWHGGEDAREDGPFASGECTTDESGAFVCAFVPTAPAGATEEGEPRYRFTCSAQVTDGSGEMHAAGTSFTVGTVPWTLDLASPCETWRTASAGTAWRLNLQTIDQKPVAGVESEVKVYALKQPKRPVRVPLTREYRYGRRGGDPSNPQNWENGEVVASAQAKTSEKGEAKGILKLPAGVYRMECVAKTADGKTVRDIEFVRVIDPTAKSYATREPVFQCFEKTTVKAGGTVRLFFGTGYESAFCRVRVTQGDEVLADETHAGTNWVYEFPVEEKHRGELNFETTFVHENRLYHENHSVSVPWDNLDLRITREHMTFRLLPDARETWRFRISGTDTNDVRRGVEALAFMFDKSLDALKWYHPILPFDNSFSLRSRYESWNVPNARANFRTWCGRWPYVPGGGFVSWPSWNSSALGLFARVSGGWRGGPGRGLRDGAVVYKCAAAPLLARAEAPAAASMDMDVDDCSVAVEESESEVAPAESKQGRTPDVSLRRNLDETAFFLPTLVSDEKGVVEFSFTVPQALTGWKFFLLAHDRNLANGGINDYDITTVKPLMVEPNGPRFAREGDAFLYPVKVSNTDDKPQRGKVTLEFFDAESGRPVSLGAAGRDGAPSPSAASIDFDLKPGESKTFEFPVEIPDGCGYLRSVAKAAGTAFTDGEEGFLPVLSRRVMVQESMPLQIRSAGEKKFSFQKLKASDESKSLRHVGLAAQVVSDPTWYAFLALPYLMEYPHECNEQVFSRFYANALAAKIANADPEYRKMFETWETAGANALKSPLELNEDLKQVMLDSTPWVREAADETRAKRHLAELFGSARLDAEQARALEKLRQNVASDGLWPWFPGGRGSTWVTMHILTGFARLNALGVKENALDSQLRRARSALDREMEKDITERLELARKHKYPFSLSSGDLRWLYLQSFDKSWNKKYAKLLFEHLEKEWTAFGIAGQSLGAIALLRRGNRPLAKAIVQSLKERAVRSEEFGLYWKRSPFFDCSLFAAPVSDQAVAMEAFLAVEPEDVDAYEDARIWMLEQKRTQNWSTTVSTVDAVYAILLGRGKGAPVKVGPVTMTLGGAEVTRANAEAGTGFYESRYGADQVKGAMGEITLARKEDALGWASVTWTYLDDVAKVDAHEQTGLRLTKTYYKKTRVNGKVRLVELGGGEKLLPGDELVARLAIDSDRILEYVHLKDERPASAEPVDVISRYRWQDGLGYYQSTRDTATHYYFDRLAKGNFVLETSFRVRQKGTFTSGLATLECMYAPEFGAHSAAQVVTVDKE